MQRAATQPADIVEEEPHNPVQGAYARTWWVATILLIVMSVLFLISSRFQGEHTWLGPVQAFAEAAMVGALADWFAVTALFRHPLGLPIPHTAIIPNNKSRIGRNLGHFIQTNFLSDQVLEGEVINISGAAAAWLGKVENRRSVVRRVRQLVPRLLETMEESEFRRFIDLQFEEFIRGVDLSKSTARIFRLLTANEMHEVFLDEVVKQTQAFFRSNEDWFRHQMREASPWFVPDFVDKKIAEAIISKTEQTFAAALADRKHELRLRVHAAMEQFIERLETAPEMQERGEEVKKLLLSNEVVRRYINSIRDGIATTIKSDIARDDSQLAAAVDRALESFVVTMTSSRDVQKKLNILIRRVMHTAFGDQSGHVAELISRTIESWDTTTLVHKMEEQVGPDLQYIRINGTIVGGLVGLCLYLLETMIQQM